ncbi:hypothetical protein MCEMSE15_01934 [Fimbriimonadaceae bacterium]
MRAWRFKKPVTPGFGIAKDYYLSVLASSATLPSMLQILNPKGDIGAVVGFGAPLASGASKDDLALPLKHGAYVLASKDQKTVLKMLLMPPQDAGFDTEAFSRSLVALDYGVDISERVRSAWHLAQFTFESHDPAVYPSLDFLLDVVSTFGSRADGVVADPISRRYLLPPQVRLFPRADERVDAREHVSVQFRLLSSGLHAYTLGMQKFAQPEFEITGLLETDQIASVTYLMALCQTVLVTGPAKLGLAYGPFQLSEGGFDMQLWQGVPVYEMLPDRTMLSSEALMSWNP